MDKIRTVLLLILMTIVIYIVTTILYTSIFIEMPYITSIGGALPFRFENISYGLIITIIGFFFIGGVLLYDYYHKTLTKRVLWYVWTVYGYLFLVFQGTLLYGSEVIGNSWLFNNFYLDAFGLYRVNVEEVSYHFFFESVGMSLFHTGIIVFAIVILWKGIFSHD